MISAIIETPSFFKKIPPLKCYYNYNYNNIIISLSCKDFFAHGDVP